ncbi:unnamed protein product [Lampetra fluviatilis]
MRDATEMETGLSSGHRSSGMKRTTREASRPVARPPPGAGCLGPAAPSERPPPHEAWVRTDPERRRHGRHRRPHPRSERVAPLAHEKDSAPRHWNNPVPESRDPHERNASQPFFTEVTRRDPRTARPGGVRTSQTHAWEASPCGERCPTAGSQGYLSSSSSSSSSSSPEEGVARVEGAVRAPLLGRAHVTSLYSLRPAEETTHGHRDQGTDSPRRGDVVASPAVGERPRRSVVPPAGTV